MKRDNITQRVIDIVSTKLVASDITATSVFYDLGADSLDQVEIFMEVEDQFSFHIPNDDMDSLKTVKDVVDYIEEHT